MKKILLSLFVGLIGFISFCSAGIYSFTGIVNNNTHRVTFPQGIINGCDFYISCFYDNTTSEYLTLIINYNGNSNFNFGSNNLKKNYGSFGFNFNNLAGCTSITNLGFYINNANNYNYTCTLYGNSITTSDCPICPTCPNPYTSLECQELYNLIPIDSVDSAYCENNNLCSIYTGEISTGYSTLFINDIRHESMPFIYVNIPEEFNRTYSTGINDFTIDVEGYNVDTEYIDGIIRTQNYKPSSEDFTNLVGLLAPYTKYLVFLLFVFVLWAWIKKSFKSKKL